MTPEGQGAKPLPLNLKLRLLRLLQHLHRLTRRVDSGAEQEVQVALGFA
jgi:hypothetical protein